MTRPIVLMYHNIGVPPAETMLRGLYVTPRMFRFQMWYLKIAGFKVVSLSEMLSFIHGETLHEKLVSITFDDGYQDFYENAFHVLRSYQYTATVFLVSDLIGKENLWDYKRVNKRKKLMDWNIIRDMKKKNIDFGAHTKTHPFLSRLSREEIEEEVRGSKASIEKNLQLPVNFFCYPYGDYDKRVVTTVKQAGYKGALTTRRGLIHKNDDPYEMRRSLIRLTTNPLLFIYRLHSDYEDRRGLRK